ncbi:golgin subfamily A member 6-like protein 10 [Seriola aureovittata]|uniref:golgin subfamily A member 6-like protein 10 n=1 Tax=Seriola aureovittata TaxID=2871759 RepID=UPI0024BDC6B9|nr:golgin subfamily A member 6-like protein 10 [Seriola aureovittata]
MEVFKSFTVVYNLFDRMKNNDQQCPHILQRLRALEKLLVFIQLKVPERLSDDMKDALEKLDKAVLSATELIKKFMDAHKLHHAMKSGDYKLEFENLNKSLTDTFVTLSVALHIQQEQRMDEQEKKLDEQELQLARQERRMAEQENKMAEQEDILQIVESKIAYESRAYYCVLQ